MKYFAMFEGIGGFSRGIEEGYERFSEDLSISEREKQGRDVETQSRANNGSSCVAIQRPCCAGVSEIDRFASAIYKYHYPAHTNYGDATQLIPESIPDFDLLTGGFPCQAFSIAGKRQGFAEARGTLFFEIARILSHKRPRYFLLENVKGLLSHDGGKTYVTILRVLADLGYFVETVVLNSKDFGVPQNRERIFFIGHLAEPGRSIREILPFGESDREFNSLQQEARSREQRVQVRPEEAQRNNECAEGGGAGSEQLHSDLIQVGNIDTAGHNSLWGRVYSTDGLAANLNANGGGMGAKPGLYVVPDNQQQPINTYADKQTPSETALTLRAEHDGGITEKHGKTMVEVKNPSLNDDGTVTALDASHYKGAGSRGNKHRAMATQLNRIRRLTPIECERLQAFPDGWTDKGLFENGETKDISDTQRYKCCGNAVTVSVIAALMEKIFAHAEATQ